MTAVAIDALLGAGYKRTAALLDAGYTLTVSEWRVAGAWYAELRRPDGRWHEGGFGPTQVAALAHLDSRLPRQDGQL